MPVLQLMIDASSVNSYDTDGGVASACILAHNSGSSCTESLVRKPPRFHVDLTGGPCAGTHDSQFGDGSWIVARCANFSAL